MASTRSLLRILAGAVDAHAGGQALELGEPHGAQGAGAARLLAASCDAVASRVVVSVTKDPSPSFAAGVQIAGPGALGQVDCWPMEPHVAAQGTASDGTMSGRHMWWVHVAAGCAGGRHRLRRRALNVTPTGWRCSVQICPRSSLSPRRSEPRCTWAPDAGDARVAAPASPPATAAAAPPRASRRAAVSTSTEGPAPEMTAAWPALAQRVDERHRRGERLAARLLVQPVLGGRPAGCRVAGEGVRPAGRRARRCGGVGVADLVGQHRAGLGGRELLAGTSDDRLDLGVQLRAAASCAPLARRVRPGERQAAEDAGGRVVGVALEPRGQALAKARSGSADAPRRTSSSAWPRRCRRRSPRPTSPARGRAGSALCTARSQARRRRPRRARPRPRRMRAARRGGSRRAGTRRRPHRSTVDPQRRARPSTVARQVVPEPEGEAEGVEARARGWRWSRGPGPATELPGARPLPRPSVLEAERRAPP